MLLLVGMEKELASPVFLHPDNHLHKIEACTSQGGENDAFTSQEGWTNIEN